jgi:type II secretory pathway pseudopilin PulG
MTLRKRVLRLWRERSGVTVVEMSVSLAVLGIVLATVTQGFISMSNGSTAADLRLQNLDQARVLMNTVSKDVRTAVIIQAGTSPFVAANGTDVVFYANLNTTTAPNKVEIKIDTTMPSNPVLVETVTKPDPGSNPPTYNTQAPKRRLVGQFVANTSANPVFTYFDASGTPIAAAPPGRALTSAEMLQVSAIGITLAIRKSVNTYLPPTTLVNRVSLPNIYYTVQASPSP